MKLNRIAVHSILSYDEACGGDHHSDHRTEEMNFPNIIMIVMDDQRSDSIGALGNSCISTPNMDSLVRRGTFLRPYTTVPVCTTARAELLTGCDSFANGCTWFGEPIDPKLTLLPEALRQAGYHCVHIGKWHNDGHPRDRGYHETHRVFPADLVGGYYREGVDWRGTHDFIYEENGQEVRGHSTELIAESAVEFLQTGSGHRPWFCFVGFHSPHDPRTAPEPWAGMYKTADVPLPANYMPEHPFDNGDMLIRDELLAPFPRTPIDIQDHLREYYAMITHHDHYIGRILHALRTAGQADDTLVILTSDHGLAIGSHGLMGKENLYEHSARVPLVISGKGIPADRRIDESCLCCHYDLMPTLLELLDIPVPESCRGNSFARTLRSEVAGEGREAVFGAYRDCMRMVRGERFKLIYYPHIDKNQLFDLKNDPEETNDLLTEWRKNPCDGPQGGSYKPNLPYHEVKDIEQQLRHRLIELQRSVGDSDP